MFRKALISAAIVAIFSVCCQGQTVVNTWWVGGESGRWGDGTQWTCDVPAGCMPDNWCQTDPYWCYLYNVTIDGGGTGATVFFSSALKQSRAIIRLDCYGEVKLENRTSDWNWVKLYISDGLTNHGDLEIDEIEINGNITNTAGADLCLIDLGIEGNLYNSAGGTIVIEYEVGVDDGGMENSGTIVIDGPSGDLCVAQTLHNTGQIKIYGGECNAGYGGLDNDSTGVIMGFGVLSAEHLLQNKGQIYAFGGSLAVAIFEGTLSNSGVLANTPLASLHVAHLGLPADVNNFGTIEVNAGGGVAFDCDLINESGAEIKLLGGTLAAKTIVQKAEASFAGFGSTTGNVVIAPNGLIKLTGPTNIVGNVDIHSGATLEISDGQTLIVGQTTNNGTIHLIGGTVIFQGGYSGSGNIINEAGTDRNRFDINANGIEDFEDFAYFAESWLWQASWY